jgi:hypothetical protein
LLFLPLSIGVFPPTFAKANKLPTKNTAKTQTATAASDLLLFFFGGAVSACFIPQLTQNISAPSSSAPHDAQNLTIVFTSDFTPVQATSSL